MVSGCEVLAKAIRFTEESIIVDLDDGRCLSVPIDWYPRLLHGTTQERKVLELTGGGRGIHWPELDEDIRVEGLIAGRRSAESDVSLSRWMQRRKSP